MIPTETSCQDALNCTCSLNEPLTLASSHLPLSPAVILQSWLIKRDWLIGAGSSSESVEGEVAVAMEIDSFAQKLYTINHHRSVPLCSVCLP
eukprot:COSAG03_NODE_1437_length_4080_cov_2.349410_7_plen_91_part_01